MDVINAIALNAMFQAAGVASDFVVSSLTIGMNRSAATQRNPQVIRDFKDGKLEVLINVNIVTEGTDIPNIQTVFLARPTTSKILMTQMIGRGLRGEAAGGTKETDIVYFIDDWKGLVDFVSPTSLLDGEDHMPSHELNRKESLRHYIELADITEYAIATYESRSSAILNYHNIIPYGIIKCSYMASDIYGEECEFSRDLLVFDEAAEIYKQILSELPALFPNLEGEYSEQEIKKISVHLYFKYCERTSGAFIGISSELIRDIILTYLAAQEIPEIQTIADRVSLFDIVKDAYSPELGENEVESLIQEIWQNNAKIRMWYDKDFYFGMMHVYFNRMKPIETNAPVFTMPPKEKMDMGEIRKHYPAYYSELREYLVLNMERDEDGYYYSDMQEEGVPRFRSKHLGMFEMDHIVPISKGGLTVKENLRMISRYENIRKGAN